MLKHKRIYYTYYFHPIKIIANHPFSQIMRNINHSS